MTDLSAGECLVRLTVRTETPHTQLLQSLTLRPELRSFSESASLAVRAFD
ncbi:MAG: hypothetical protein IJV11_10250 [Muribaculaceae bacterium]|nr:hypothetical protein [Muribaculaceae bacterium]